MDRDELAFQCLQRACLDFVQTGEKLPETEAAVARARAYYVFVSEPALTGPTLTGPVLTGD